MLVAGVVVGYKVINSGLLSTGRLRSRVVDRNSSGGVLVGVYVLIYVRFTSNTTSKVTCLVLLSQEDLIWASLFVSIRVEHTPKACVE